MWRGSWGSGWFLAPSGGIYDIKKIEEEAEVHPDMVVKTPVLWHGSFTDTKSVHAITYQATGNGTAVLEVTDDMEQVIHSDTFEISDSGDDNNYPDVPLSRQYERKFCRSLQRSAVQANGKRERHFAELLGLA